MLSILYRHLIKHMKNKLLLVVTLFVTLVCNAQQIIDIGTNPNDGTGDTLRTAFTKVNSNFVTIFPLLTNVPASNVNGTITNPVATTNIVINGPNIGFKYLQTNIPNTYAQGVPMFCNFVPGGNLQYNDCLIIACNDLLPNSYADIAFGYFGSGNNTDPTNFVTSGGIGVSSAGGNWGIPWTGQSNYGVWFPGALTLATVGGTAFIISGDYPGGPGGDVPEFFVSTNGHFIMMTDRVTGQTNYFVLNRDTANMSIPYGEIDTLAHVTDTNNSFVFLCSEITNGASGIVISNTTGTAYTYLITSRPGATNRLATLLGTSP